MAHHWADSDGLSPRPLILSSNPPICMCGIQTRCFHAGGQTSHNPNMIPKADRKTGSQREAAARFTHASRWVAAQKHADKMAKFRANFGHDQEMSIAGNQGRLSSFSICAKGTIVPRV